MGRICHQIRLQQMFLPHLSDALEHPTQWTKLCVYSVGLVVVCITVVYHLDPSELLQHVVR